MHSPIFSRRRWLALAMLVAIPAVAVGAEGTQCMPRFEQGWIRLSPAAMPMKAGFGRLLNACPTPIVVVGASSPAFGEVSLHETRIENDVSRMREVERLKVAAAQTAVLEPGGLHLMLMRPRTSLAEGGKVTVEFELQDGRRVTGELTVRKNAP
jgi:copper(I)-binding protein